VIGGAIDPQHAVDQDPDPVGYPLHVAEDVGAEQYRPAATLDDLDQRLQETGEGLRQVEKDGEHSLEIQLPFLQRTLSGEFEILPLMLRSHNPAILRTLAGTLVTLLADKKFLLVASTDLSHFYPEETAKEMDMRMLAHIERMDPAGALEAEKTGQAAACGVSAVAAMLWAAQSLGARQAKILHYSTSGDVSGDRASVVGYGSAAIVK